MAAKKTTTKKAVATKAAEVKATDVKVETMPAAKAVKKETVKKETAKETTKKTAAKKPAKKQEVYIQFGGREVLEQEVLDKVKKAWTDLGNKVGDMADVKIYIKPEEFKAYYVINGDVTGNVEM